MKRTFDDCGDHDGCDDDHGDDDHGDDHDDDDDHDHVNEDDDHDKDSNDVVSHATLTTIQLCRLERSSAARERPQRFRHR